MIYFEHYKSYVIFEKDLKALRFLYLYENIYLKKVKIKIQ